MKVFNQFVYGLMSLMMSLAFATTASAQISMNDVTLLLPIPKSQAELKANYLNPSTMISSGALVSSTRIKLFTEWSDIDATLDLTRRENLDRLAVLGIRLDPCFKDLFSDICRPQIRLVLQPILFTGTQPTADDVGVHAFFDTTQDKIIDLIQFASNYRNQFLGQGSARAPLQIHPVIQQEGITGKYWQAMRAKIQNVLNQSTPSRLAFFVTHPSGRAWTFQSFNLRGLQSQVITIPGVNTTQERIDNQIQGSVVEFLTSSGLLGNSMAGSDQTFDFLTDSVRFLRSGQNRINPLLTTLDRLENPRTHLPGTIDCLSCHSAPAIKKDLRKNSINPMGTVAAFISSTLPRSSLINLFEDDYESRDFRLFGYRNASPIVGQRVINESASIVDSLSHP